MKVSLQLFASVREAVGQRNVSLELDDGARVGDLKLRLGQTYPALEPMLKTVVFAMNDEYVSAEEPLRDGSSLAVIPPVSGRSDDDVDLFQLTTDPIEAIAPKLAERVRTDFDGAVALFYGVVRNNSDGQDVARLEYESHQTMALAKMRQAAAETKAAFPEISEIGIWHRVGMLQIGETSLLVAVSSPHRKEAFDACHWAVDRIKQIVPVWKKEHWRAGGGAWVPGYVVDAPETASR
jgi:molybdopterin converting factor subunit 1